MNEGDVGSGQEENKPLRYFVPGELIVAVKHTGSLPKTWFMRNPMFFIEQEETADLLLQAFINQGMPDDKLGFVKDAKIEAEGYLRDKEWVTNALDESEPFVEGEDISFVRLRIEKLAIDGSNNEPNANETLIYLAGELELRAKSQPDRQKGPTVASVSLNWLWSSAPDNGTTGGPGSLPVPPDPTSFNPGNEFGFDTWEAGAGAAVLKVPQPPHAQQRRGELKIKLSERPTFCPVEVVILDTIPPEDALTKWRGRAGVEMSTELRNAELSDLIAHLEEGKHRYEGNPASAVDVVFKWPTPDDIYHIKDQPYDMSDHGLFIASIVHRIAPHAKIRLIEVLNKYAVGSTRALIWGLQQVIKSCGQGTLLIINASLTIGFPSDPATAAVKKGKRPTDVETFISLLEELDGKYLQALNINLPPTAMRLKFSLASTVEDMYQKVEGAFPNVVSVAAAGNDNPDMADGSFLNRREARRPAVFGNVIGVGALTRTGEIARYSNQPDDPAPQGFYAFGGDVSDDEPQIDGKWIAHRKNGILGLYTHSSYAGDPSASNNSGWARWAGTSFAAAVVTGVLAQTYPPPLVEFLRGVAEEKRDEGHVLPVRQGK
jgi:hypothetical protein